MQLEADEIGLEKLVFDVDKGKAGIDAIAGFRRKNSRTGFAKAISL
jgi:hypothetical protein